MFEIIGFALYSLFALVLFTCSYGVVLMLEFLSENWDVVSLMISNVIALLVDPKKLRKK